MFLRNSARLVSRACTAAVHSSRGIAAWTPAAAEANGAGSDVRGRTLYLSHAHLCTLSSKVPPSYPLRPLICIECLGVFTEHIAEWARCAKHG